MKVPLWSYCLKKKKKNLTQLAFKSVCEQTKDWQKPGYELMKYKLNVMLPHCTFTMYCKIIKVTAYSSKIMLEIHILYNYNKSATVY